jgi:LacI family transcriptional regulator
MSGSSQKRRTRAATLADVGREAGVSAMAASAVLNATKTSARISADTEARIRRAALKLNYRPNVAARALVHRRMNTIGMTVVVRGGELNHYFVEVFNGIIEGAARAKQNTTVFALHEWETAAGEIERFCDGRIDGMILMAPVLGGEGVARLPHHTPFVTLHSNAPIPGAVNLEAEEKGGARAMVEWLLAQGHERILHLRGPHGLIGAERRVEGYREALATAGVAFRPEYVCLCDYTRASGKEVMRSWLRGHVGEWLPSAIVCANDAVAMGCIEALGEAGIRVPGEVSVTGFDDTLSARTIVPQLTTVRQPLRAMGVKAVEVLLERIECFRDEEEVREFEPLVFPTEMVLRASTAPPPARARRVKALPRVAD